MRLVLTLCLVTLGCASSAQPYLDLASLRYGRGFDGGLVRQDHTRNQFHYGQAQVQLPLRFKKDSSILMINPIMETWQIRLSIPQSIPDRLTGKAIIAGYIKPWSRKLTTSTLLITRWNGADVPASDQFQIGGIALATLTKSLALKYKFGVYFNREFFGNFIVPLLGIEYRIHPRLQLFGTLPGNLVLEKKVNRHFYYGALFRAVTTSYRFANGDSKQFIRIDENQLKAFADYYLAPQIVLTAELGHSAFRRFRLGEEGSPTKYYMKDQFNDGVVARLALAYRLRFNQ